MYEIDLSKPREIVADVLSNHEIDSVAFVGCGASMSELYPAKYFLANNTKTLNVQIFTANEFNYDTPAWLGPNTFVITCSLGGGTPVAVQAEDLVLIAAEEVFDANDEVVKVIAFVASPSEITKALANWPDQTQKVVYPFSGMHAIVFEV